MIIVTAPTSKIGRQVLAGIIGGNEPVRVIARDSSKLSSDVRDAVEVVTGSHRDGAVVAQAFEGARAVFWLVPADPRAENADTAYLDFSRPAIDAFRTCRVQQVVGISSVGRGWPKDAGNITATLKLDDMIADTGVNYRALTCATFMDNVLRQVSSIAAAGVLSGTAPGDLKMAMCATRDIASAAVDLLLDRTWTGRGACPILGPEDLSFDDVVAIISDMLRRPVRYERTAPEVFRAALVSREMSAGMTQSVMNMMAAQNEGIDRMERRSALSTTPTTFRQFCAEVLVPALSP